MRLAKQVRELIADWRARAAQLHRYQSAAAIAFEEAASELEAAVASAEGRHLTLSEASELSGYHAETLARLIRHGRIPNAGRRGAPRIRLGDLPRRTEAAARAASERRMDRVHTRQYDVAADARSLRSRRKGGAYGDPKPSA